MGFPTRCTQEFLPTLYVKLTTLIHFLKFLLIRIRIRIQTRPDDPPWPELRPEFKSASAALIQDMLPPTKFGAGAGSGSGDPDPCAICLSEFRARDEIRRLVNCKHVFHRRCVDRWMEQDQRNCPLCRTSFVPDHLVDVFNQRVDAASVSCFPEFGSEFSVINTFL